MDLQKRDRRRDSVMDVGTFSRAFIAELETYYQKQNGRTEIYPVQTDGGTIQAVALRFQDSPIAVTFYPELFFEHYEEKTGIGPLVRMAASSIALLRPLDLETYQITKEKTAQCLRAGVISFQENQNRLKNVPHERFMDLAIIPKWYYTPGYSVDVNSQVMAGLGMTKEEILEEAKEHTFHMVKEMQTLEAVNQTYDEPEKFRTRNKNPYEQKMYILSTEGYQEGSVVIADRNTLQSIYKKLGDFYIFPDREYRVLVMAQSACEDPERIMEQILEEKRMTYDWAPTLSKRVYAYDGRQLTYAGTNALNLKEEAPKQKIQKHRR